MDNVEPVRIDLWQANKMPNSRLQGNALPADSIVNHRIWRCGMPRIYAYQPVAEERSKTAVILIPGGGYIKQAYEVSGISLAKWLNSIGITAFVLLHRLPNQPELIDPWKAPLQDAQRAIRFVRAHAEEFGIDPERIGVMGTSAGGHFSACVSTITEDWSAIGDEYDKVPFLPNFAILVSPIINELESETAGNRLDLCGASKDDPTWSKLFAIDKSVTSANPPTLMIHASDDPAVPVLNSVKMYEALKKAGVEECSLHIFPFGKHAIAMRHQPGSTALWPVIAEEWMKEIGVF
ncbi:MAG: alpha/beta hydrolase [Bacteroidales bacterium]|nr:alpha/beta hydrolase [Bacteroidales bacterium]